MLYNTAFVSTILLCFFTIQLSRCSTVGDNLIWGKFTEETNVPSPNNDEWVSKDLNEVPDSDSSQDSVIQPYNSQPRTMVLKGLEEPQFQQNISSQENVLVQKINQLSPDAVQDLIQQEKAIDGANQEIIRILQQLNQISQEKVQELLDLEKKIHDARKIKSRVLKILKNISPRETREFVQQERVVEVAKKEKTRILQQLNKVSPKVTRQLIKTYDNVISHRSVNSSPFKGYPLSAKEEAKEEYYDDTSVPSPNNDKRVSKVLNEIPDSDSSQDSVIQPYNSQPSTMILKGLEEPQSQQNTPSKENDLVQNINKLSPDAVNNLIQQEKAIDGANQEIIRVLQQLDQNSHNNVTKLLQQEKKIHNARKKKSSLLTKLKKISPGPTSEFVQQERVVEGAKKEKTRILQQLSKLSPEVTQNFIKQYDKVISHISEYSSPFEGYPLSAKEEAKEEYYDDIVSFPQAESNGTIPQDFAPTQPASQIQYDTTVGHITEPNAGHRVTPPMGTQQAAFEVLQANQIPAFEGAPAPPAYEQPPQAYVQALSLPPPPAYEQPAQAYVSPLSLPPPPAYEQPAQAYAQPLSPPPPPAYEQPAQAYAQPLSPPPPPAYEQPAQAYAQPLSPSPPPAYEQLAQAYAQPLSPPPPPAYEQPPQADEQPLSLPSTPAYEKPQLPPVSAAHLEPAQNPAPPRRHFPLPRLNLSPLQEVQQISPVVDQGHKTLQSSNSWDWYSRPATPAFTEQLPYSYKKPDYYQDQKSAINQATSYRSPTRLEQPASMRYGSPPAYEQLASRPGYVTYDVTPKSPVPGLSLATYNKVVKEYLSKMKVPISSFGQPVYSPANYAAAYQHAKQYAERAAAA